MTSSPAANPTTLLLIDRVIASLHHQVDQLAINANHRAGDDPHRFDFTALPILPDEHIANDNESPITTDDNLAATNHTTSHQQGSIGPLLGIYTALRWAEQQGANRVLTVTCDCPQLPPDLYQRLAASLTASASDHAANPSSLIATATSNGRSHPPIALWSTSLARALAIAIKNGMRKIDHFTAPYQPRLVDFSPASGQAADDPFLNLNTPEEFEQWRDHQATMRFNNNHKSNI